MNAELMGVGTLLLILAVIPAYGVLWELHQVPWNKGPYRKLGRVLFSKSAVIVLILTLSTVGAILLIFGHGRPLWYEVIRLCAFALIIPVLYWQWYVYRRTRLAGLAEPATHRADDDDVSGHFTH
jgi:protein-S-isoprenylcysteine O-methyltransferase Ste14